MFRMEKRMHIQETFCLTKVGDGRLVMSYGRFLVHLADMSQMDPEVYGTFTTIVINLMESTNARVCRRRQKKKSTHCTLKMQ